MAQHGTDDFMWQVMRSDGPEIAVVIQMIYAEIEWKDANQREMVIKYSVNLVGIPQFAMTLNGKIMIVNGSIVEQHCVQNGENPLSR